MTVPQKKWIARIGILLIAGAVAWAAWIYLKPASLGPGFASANGRLEAVDIDIAAKIAGRLKAVMVDEGDFVTAGQVLAKMDTSVLEAQRREAEAALKQAQIGIVAAQSQVTQRKAEKQSAVATLAMRKAEAEAAQKRFERSEELTKRGTASVETLDNDKARHEGAKAAVSAAEAQIAAADAAISSAESQVINVTASAEAAKATIERIQADINDSTLTSPRDGRVQYRVAQPGEVLGAGGKVLNLVDLSDVYMTFFLPTRAAGQISMGADVRLVMDAASQYVIPARVSFVADVAQFTPKTVETAEEREKLMFRVKARIDPELLRKYMRIVKTGVPGMAYVRLDPNAVWPDKLQTRLPAQ